MRDERERGEGERGEEEEEEHPTEEEREKDGLSMPPRQPETVGSSQHLHVLSSGEFHEACSGGSVGGSIGVDTSPVFQTPETGNSPRISVASVAEGEEGREKEGDGEGERTLVSAQRHINFQISNSPLLDRKPMRPSDREEGEEQNAPGSSTPIQKSGLAADPISGVGGKTKSFVDRTENHNREHLSEGGDPANYFTVAQPSLHYWPLQRTPPSSKVREMTDSASFGGLGVGGREEEASAGCGTLEESYASGASGGGGWGGVKGGRGDQLPDQLGLLQNVQLGQDGVKGQLMAPPPSLESSVVRDQGMLENTGMGIHVCHSLSLHPCFSLFLLPPSHLTSFSSSPPASSPPTRAPTEIGRASWRGRVVMWVVGV